MKNKGHAKKYNNSGIGGDAGEIYIAARKICGNGSIVADGGDGHMGGNGGKITIISDDNQFQGGISAQGGKSNIQFRKWWETTWIQVIMLIGAIAGIIGLIYFFI